METNPNHAGSHFVHVAVAIVENADGKILISRRPEHVHQGGLWEFPGGKLEAGEGVEAALQRELREELGIKVETARPLIRLYHHYPDKAVLLDVWRVTRYRGEASGLEGQPIEWVAANRLGERSFPQADVPIIQALNLPQRYLITPEPRMPSTQFLAGLERALDAGISLVQLRAKTLPSPAYRGLAKEVQALCRAAGASLLVNAEPALALELEITGVHLGAQRLLAMRERPTGIQLLAASCHCSAEVQHAAELGVDFIVISPVLKTRSHPDAEPIGFKGLRELTEVATMPVYALGGMQESDLEQVINFGAQGIAAIRGLWDPGKHRDE